jgi:hypothetical protein
MLSFFSSQLIEELIQYIINEAVRVHGFMEKLGVADLQHITPSPFQCVMALAV